MDIEDLGPRLDEAADRVGPEIERAVNRQAKVLRAMIRGNASGRPGPNIITGDYWASWRVETHPIPHGGAAVVGTGRPQGRRLEFGFFNMRDSLGRLFFQPPYPHVGPALTVFSPRFRDAIGEAVEEVFE